LETPTLKRLRVIAPGRINLLGEHLDYNHGIVLPAAIDRHFEFEIQARQSPLILIEALDLNEQWEFLWAELSDSATSGWKNYVKGVLLLMGLDSHQPAGLHIRFTSNIPIGAGLSSSAALCCGLAFGLNEFYDLGKTRQELALLAQQTEHQFAGVKCGLMDQVASLFGKANHLLAFDCISHDITPFELPLHGAQLFLIDSKVKHNLAESAYNQRRASMEQAWAIAQELFPHLENWRDLNTANTAQLFEKLDAETQKRLQYVLEEIKRVEAVQKLASALVAADLSVKHEEWLEQLGACLSQTHMGLSVLYEVSCAELDFLQDQVTKHPGVYGARMMGGGFGGCLLVLASAEFEPSSALPPIFSAYQNQFGSTALHYPIALAAGVHVGAS
jgi:galactokinase